MYQLPCFSLHLVLRPYNLTFDKASVENHGRLPAGVHHDNAVVDACEDKVVGLRHHFGEKFVVTINGLPECA